MPRTTSIIAPTRAESSAIATIYLSDGSLATVDFEDYEIVSRLKWRPKRDRSCTYAIASPPGSRSNLYMHRIVLGLSESTPEVDHINHDGLDNRKANLRLATRAENLTNRRKFKSGSSKYKGVSFCARDGVWRAHIQVAGKHRHIGQYKNEMDAAKAYDAAAVEHAGSFACLNFTYPQQIG